MGGCASRPKEHNPEALPTEDPAAPEQTTRAVEGDAPTDIKAENAEETEKQPLVDLSESKPEEPSSPNGDKLVTEVSELKAEPSAESGETEEKALAAEDQKKDVATVEQPSESSEKKEESKPIEASA